MEGEEKAQWIADQQRDHLKELARTKKFEKRKNRPHNRKYDENSDKNASIDSSEDYWEEFEPRKNFNADMLDFAIDMDKGLEQN